MSHEKILVINSNKNNSETLTIPEIVRGMLLSLGLIGAGLLTLGSISWAASGADAASAAAAGLDGAAAVASSVDAAGTDAAALDGASVAAARAAGAKAARDSDEIQIIGGGAVSASDSIASTTVALINGGALCTASLIASDLAVTAAHCVEGARAGSIHVVFGRNTRTGVKAPVIGAVFSSRWGTVQDADEADHGDIAVVRFTGGLQPGFKVAKILKDTSGLSEGQTVTLAGYGITQTHPHTGSGSLRKTTVMIADANHGNTEIIFDQTDGRGACHGDSGGPAFVNVKGTQYVLGVTNRGHLDPRDTCGQYVVYTKIGAYSSFITAAARQLRR
jgi:hypothetical protein